MATFCSHHPVPSMSLLSLPNQLTLAAHAEWPRRLGSPGNQVHPHFTELNPRAGQDRPEAPHLGPLGIPPKLKPPVRAAFISQGRSEG